MARRPVAPAKAEVQRLRARPWVERPQPTPTATYQAEAVAWVAKRWQMPAAKRFVMVALNGLVVEGPLARIQHRLAARQAAADRRVQPVFRLSAELRRAGEPRPPVVRRPEPALQREALS